MQLFDTERLSLRWLSLADAPLIYDLLNEPGWQRFIGGQGLADLDGAREYLQQRVLSMYERQGFGLYRVALRADDTPVGLCGLIKRESLDDVDLGFALLSRYGGQGYAREAAAGTLRYARAVLGLARIVAITAPDNLVSARLLGDLGFSEAGPGPLSPDGQPCRLFVCEPPVSDRLP